MLFRKYAALAAADTSDCAAGLLKAFFLSRKSDSVARRRRVICEHLHGLERIVVEALSDQRQLLENVVGHRDDVTCDRVGVEDVQELTRTGPDQLGGRRDLQQ